jgi:hypothetical protein
VVDCTSNFQLPSLSCTKVTGLGHFLNAGGGDPTGARRQANVAPALELLKANVALVTPIVLAGVDVIVVWGTRSWTLNLNLAGVGSTGPAGDVDLASKV